MKRLNEYIFEDKMKYELSKDFKNNEIKTLNELIDAIPAYPDYIKGSTGGARNSDSIGKFYYRTIYYPGDDLLVVGQPAESAKYKGTSVDLIMDFDTKTNSQIDVDLIKSTFTSAFGVKITEGVFDDNVHKNFPEFEWVYSFYNALSRFFKTKKFSNIQTYYNSPYSWPSGIFNKLQNNPTVKVNDVYISLYGINFKSTDKNCAYGKIIMTVFIYEEKDPAKIAEIKSYNDSLKPYDVVGRELLVGDTIAYAVLGGYGKYSGMDVGQITAVSHEQVKVDNRNVYANRCCLISRKDGKRIE